MNRILVNHTSLLVQSLCQAVVPLLIIPHLIQGIGLGPFGILAMAMSVGSLGVTVVNYAFYLTGVPRAVEECDPGRTLRVGLLAKVWLCGAVLLALIPLSWAALAGGYPAEGLLLLWGMPLAAAFTVPWSLQAADAYLTLLLCSVVGVVVASGLGFSLVNGPDDTWAAAATLLAPMAVNAAFMLTWAWRRLRPRDVGGLRSAARGLLRRDFPIFLAVALAAAHSQTGPLILGLVVSIADAGAFAAVERVVLLGMGGCNLIYVAAYPALVRARREDRVAYRRTLGVVLVVYLAMAGTLLAVLIVGKSIVVRLLLGSAAMPAHEMWLVALASLLVVGFLGFMVSGHLVMIGRRRHLLVLTAISMIWTLGFGITWSSSWGVMGWIAAVLSGQLPMAVWALALVWEGMRPLSPPPSVAGGTDT